MPNKTNDFKTKLTSVHRAINAWYQSKGRRGLPWRNTSDPYAIYISEVMLQQTQVKTVLERYYAPFLEHFPTLAALAKASRQDVMKQWEGLGYYSRAANLHTAAQQCKTGLPEDVDALIALPGIGRNTANAIACFAHNKAYPVMEANVKRVLCRVFAVQKPDDKDLWQKATLLLDTRNPFDYNQAMMDIGALICTKRNPQCSLCPLASICAGKASPHSYPSAKTSKKVPVRQKNIIAIMDGAGHFYVQKRQTRFLNGLYGFMECEADAQSIAVGGKAHKLQPKDKLGAVTQVYSHFILNALVYLVEIKNTESALLNGYERIAFKKIRELPLSKADLKIVEMIAMHIA
jgi:A/G-specific adenine glycosylase